MDAKKKKFRLTEKQKENLKAGLAIGGAALAVLGYGCLIGVGIGANANDKQIGRGLDMCFEEDPTLKQHLVDTIMKVQAKQLMEAKGL